MSNLIVHETIQDLASLIENVVVFDNDTTKVYQHDDLLVKAKYAERQYGKPVIGLVYMGLQALTDATKSGAKAKLIVDVYLLGLEGEARLKSKGTVEVTGLTLLDHVRKGIKAKRSPGHTVWQFVHELPTQLGIGDLEFVQRWATVVPI